MFYPKGTTSAVESPALYWVFALNEENVLVPKLAVVLSLSLFCASKSDALSLQRVCEGCRVMEVIRLCVMLKISIFMKFRAQ